MSKSLLERLKNAGSIIAQTDSIDEDVPTESVDDQKIGLLPEWATDLIRKKEGSPNESLRAIIQAESNDKENTFSQLKKLLGK